MSFPVSKFPFLYSENSQSWLEGAELLRVLSLQRTKDRSLEIPTQVSKKQLSHYLALLLKITISITIIIYIISFFA